MTNYKITVKGEGRDRFELIEADDAREAKKIFRAKNNLEDMKLSQFDARVVLANLTQERIDEIDAKRRGN